MLTLTCYILYSVIALLLSEDEEEDVHLAPSSADDAPRVTNLGQESAGLASGVPSRPSGRVVGIIRRNWKSYVILDLFLKFLVFSLKLVVAFSFVVLILIYLPLALLSPYLHLHDKFYLLIVFLLVLYYFKCFVVHKFIS